MTTAWALSEEFEDGVRLAAVQLSDVPSVPARPAVPGQLRGPALLCALRGAPTRARGAEPDTVPVPSVRQQQRQDRIPPQPGQRGGGDNIASAANDAQTVPTLGAFITMLTQRRGVGSWGGGAARAAGSGGAVCGGDRAPMLSPFTQRLQFEQQLAELTAARAAARGHAGRWLEEAAWQRPPPRRGAERGEPEAQVRSC